MNTMALTSTFLASLMRRFPDAHIQEQVTSLPKKWQAIFLQTLPNTSQEPEQLLIGYRRLTGLLHVSWHEELLMGLPEGIRASAACFGIQPANSFEQFLLDYAVAHSSFSKIEDISSCSGSKWVWLLSLSDEEIVTVIQLLSLFSVVEPFLHILDKPRLQKLASMLTSQQKKFLSYLLLITRPTPFEPFNLSAFLVHNKTDAAKIALFNRGVQLFAEALYGESETLIWRICYKVEIGLGKQIYSCWQQVEKNFRSASDALSIVHTFMKGRK